MSFHLKINRNEENGMGSPQRLPFWERGNSLPPRNQEIAHSENNAAKIGNSGNSDVDIHVHVEVDTKSIAYAMLCSLLATKQLTNSEFEEALNKLEDLAARDKKKMSSESNNLSRVKLYNPHNSENH